MLTNDDCRSSRGSTLDCFSIVTEFLNRYVAGDRMAVWSELAALGEGVRGKRMKADAEAVAEETMRRARYNIEILIPRLAGMGYRFAAPAIEREVAKIHKDMTEPKLNAYVLKQMEKAVAAGKLPESALNPKERPSFPLHLVTLRKKKIALEAELERMATMDPLENPRVFYPPEEQTSENLKRTEKLAKGPLPLSIRSWYRHIGYVSLCGEHPTINPGGCATGDPLVVRPLPDLMKGLIIGRQNGKTVLTISGNDVSKTGLEGGKPYTITIPNAGADVELENEWRQTTFVHYLRKAFEWGGFPGWERDASAPRDAIAALTDGLLPI
jgi:hypothetical protein